MAIKLAVRILADSLQLTVAIIELPRAMTFAIPQAAFAGEFPVSEEFLVSSVGVPVECFLHEAAPDGTRATSFASFDVPTWITLCLPWGAWQAPHYFIWAI
jgi:hypothetical protein